MSTYVIDYKYINTLHNLGNHYHVINDLKCEIKTEIFSFLSFKKTTKGKHMYMISKKWKERTHVAI